MSSQIEPVPSDGAWGNLPLSEKTLITALALLSLILRAFAFFNYRFDSDEPQHLHVAWGWTAGLVQYRDFFDNHAPLFHILSAPILALVGERPDVIFYMRLTMLPLFAVVVCATFILGQRLYAFRVGVWAALILSLTTIFFLKSIEYRTDNLWNTLWMIALVLLTGGSLTNSRMFLIGVILGVALCVSLKTTLLVITLGGAFIIVHVCRERRPAFSRVARLALAALAGSVIVPAIVCAYFIWRGAWPSLLYCNFTFHELVARTHDRAWLGHAIYPFAMLLLIYRVRVASRANDVDGRSLWTFFFAVALGVYVITLGGFWMIISARDSLPIAPLVAIFIVKAIVDGRRARLYSVPLLLAVSLTFAGLTIWYGQPFQNQTRGQIAQLRQVLNLSRPGEPVMDLKGEAIFRRRPVYNIYETITRTATRQGLLRDTIPESVVAAGCHVAIADLEFIPQRARAFLNENFIEVGRWRASGQWLGADGSFSIAVAGEYVILTSSGPARGLLDGMPYDGPRVLTPGRHAFKAVDERLRLAVFWAPAYARGYSPFRLRDR